VSAYAVNLVGRKTLRDAEFSRRLGEDPELALEQFDLTPEERVALLAGDVATLYSLGAHEYLLMGLARREVLGLDMPTFSDRIRTAEPRLNY
jgi:predicted nuclease with RNAse H fold